MPHFLEEKHCSSLTLSSGFVCIGSLKNVLLSATILRRKIENSRGMFDQSFLSSLITTLIRLDVAELVLDQSDIPDETDI